MQILCATNFTQSAMDAADVAAAMAKKLDLPLRLIFCAEDWAAMGEIPAGSVDESSARRQLNAEAQRLHATGITVHGEVRLGSPGSEVAAAAGEIPTKLLVLGPVTDTFPSTSVAAFSVRSAPVPTLIVQRPAPLLKWLRESMTLRLLCGVDFTLTADAALAFLQELKLLGNIDIAAGHISMDQSAGEEALETFERRLWERLRTVLGDVPSLAELPAAIHVRTSLKQPADDFADLAEELDSDLMVIGTHQHRGLHRIVRGSFADAVVHRAETNVLCVPVCSYHPRLRLPTIHRVLVATDFSECGNAAVRHALGLVRAGDAVRLFHVCPSPMPSDVLAVESETYAPSDPITADVIKQAEASLAALIPRLLAVTEVHVTCEAVAGRDAAGAICDAADRFGADVICMGTTGHTRARIALVGSTVQAVLARTHVPVFAATAPAQ